MLSLLLFLWEKIDAPKRVWVTIARQVFCLSCRWRWWPLMLLALYLMSLMCIRLLIWLASYSRRWMVPPLFIESQAHRGDRWPIKSEGYPYLHVMTGPFDNLIQQVQYWQWKNTDKNGFLKQMRKPWFVWGNISKTVFDQLLVVFLLRITSCLFYQYMIRVANGSYKPHDFKLCCYRNLRILCCFHVDTLPKVHIWTSYSFDISHQYY